MLINKRVKEAIDFYSLIVGNLLANREHAQSTQNFSPIALIGAEIIGLEVSPPS